MHVREAKLYISATNPVLYNPASVATVHEKRFSETASLLWQQQGEEKGRRGISDGHKCRSLLS